MSTPTQPDAEDNVKRSIESLTDAEIIWLAWEESNIFTISELNIEKERLSKMCNALVKKKKRLYSNMDIESPMSADEKTLTNKINSIYSRINSIIALKRAQK